MDKQEQLTRGEFLKRCAVGACSCVAMAAIPAPAVAASNDEAEWWKNQLDRARVRFAEMVRVLEQTLDEPTRKKVFASVGRECARQFRADTWEKYMGNLDAFVKDMQGPSGWFEKAEFDEKNRVLTITDRPKKCSCPLVKQGTTPATQCLCTLGWQEETYSRIVGKPIRATIVKSVLRGDDSCVFRIEILS